MKEKLKFITIDTSDENFTAVYLYKDGEIFEKTSYLERGHIKNLMPFISFVLEEAGLKISELDFISLVEGPGSWTGLRIGFSTVKVLCMVNNLNLILVNNFELMQKYFINSENFTEYAFLIKSSNKNYYYRYSLKGEEFIDGIASEETLKQKYPNIHCINFEKLDKKNYLETSVEKFKNKKFTDVDNSEPYYISVGDLRSNFKQAKL
jgi:tRNA threonylcarbamoyl adenosine modification protein YeaZ